ncbi:MAG TPA: serine/threonine-protein kinase [Polyangiaceae bacterium]|nr:serine/threonine-protein kinase [Polyangiaceae bacterium]
MTEGAAPKKPGLRALMMPAPKVPPRVVTTDASLPAPALPETDQTRNGRLSIEEEVGRGAMGFVLRATDGQLRRDLALKVAPAPRNELSREQLARFIEEAQITAQLEHPNVVPVHDIGVDPEGRPYFSMKLIRGQSLEAILEKRKAGDPGTLAEFGLRRLLDVFLQACQAVEYAHARGVIHRDLKPANIMVGDFGEVLVMDWGVAKLLGRPDAPVSEPSIGDGSSPVPPRPSYAPPPEVTSIRAGKRGLATQLGTVLGTPAYMAPEQASGGAVDERSDVYSLGVILYEILCGELPFDHEDPQVILSLQMTEPPMPPSVVNPATPLALENLALRMLEKSPDERSLTIRRIRAHVLDYIEGFGLDFRRDSVWTNLQWFIGTVGLFAFLVWYLTGHSVRSLLVLAPSSVFNAFGWFLLVLSFRYPLWAAYVSFSQSRREHDRFKEPSEEDVFVSGYAAHRTFAAALAPVFQLGFVVELVSAAVSQATRQVGPDDVVEQVVVQLRAGWANALISILVFLFAYLTLLSAEVRFARRIDRHALFVARPEWESTWPVFLMFVLLLSITATGLLDWTLGRSTFDPVRFLWERVLTEPLDPFDMVKTLVFQGTFLLGLVAATVLSSFPFAEILAALRLPHQAADEASVSGRQQYFLRSMAFFRIARASWLYGGAMIGCLTAITVLSSGGKQPLAQQVLYISGPSLLGFSGFWFTRRYVLRYLDGAPAVRRMLDQRAADALVEQARVNHAHVAGSAVRTRLGEFAVPVVCVFSYLLWTGSGMDEAAIRSLVLPVSTKGYLLILPYALLFPVILLRDGVQAWRLRRRERLASAGEP